VGLESLPPSGAFHTHESHRSHAPPRPAPRSRRLHRAGGRAAPIPGSLRERVVGGLDADPRARAAAGLPRRRAHDRCRWHGHERRRRQARPHRDGRRHGERQRGAARRRGTRARAGGQQPLHGRRRSGGQHGLEHGHRRARPRPLARRDRLAVRRQRGVRGGAAAHGPGTRDGRDRQREGLLLCGAGEHAARRGRDRHLGHHVDGWSAQCPGARAARRSADDARAGADRERRQRAVPRARRERRGPRPQRRRRQHGRTRAGARQRCPRDSAREVHGEGHGGSRRAPTRPRRVAGRSTTTLARSPTGGLRTAPRTTRTRRTRSCTTSG
jgi:hypothetical protein